MQHRGDLDAAYRKIVLYIAAKQLSIDMDLRKIKDRLTTFLELVSLAEKCFIKFRPQNFPVVSRHFQFSSVNDAKLPATIGVKHPKHAPFPVLTT